MSCCGEETKVRGYFWRPIATPAQTRLAQVIKAWMGTPYMPGQRVRGGGCDCVQLIVGMMDQLYRRPIPTELTPNAPDSGLHNGKIGAMTIRALASAYSATRILDRTIEPGDVIVTKAETTPDAARRPGHTMIAGPVQWSAVHATSNSNGVALTSLPAAPCILSVWRPAEKYRWT